MIILSYHAFTEKPDPYVFSRTYDQFIKDVEEKYFDLITMDDGRVSQIKACELLREKNHRAKIAVITGFVGIKESSDRYMTWEEIKKLSKYHDIINHTHLHRDLTTLSDEQVRETIKIANKLIEKNIGKKPRYLIPPYNQIDFRVEEICKKEGMEVIKNRITITNLSK